MTGQLSDIELKNKLINSAETQNSKVAPTYSFPTEIIDLPSHGMFYPEGHALSTGKIEIKYMTSKEEDILSSTTLIRNGVVIDKLLQSIIVTKFDYNDLLLIDKNAIMYAARVLAYGKDYDVEITCPKCTEKSKISIDLQSLDELEFDWDKVTKGINSFEFILPASKAKITFKLLTHRDEMLIEEELKGLKKLSKISGIDPELSTRLKYVITSVNGDTNPITIRTFVDTMLSRDTFELRKFIKKNSPGINNKFLFVCPECKYEEESQIPMELSFFWPRA